MNISESKLPEWLKKELPEPQLPSVISWTEEDGYIVFDEIHEETDNFETLEEAYDFTENYLKTEVIFDESIPELNEENNNNFSRMLFGTPDDRGNSRLLFSSPDKQKIEDLEEVYENFLNLAEKYYNNKNDFMTAYDFVDTHPAFWVKLLKDKEKTFLWETESHCIKIWSMPIKNDDNMFWALETGMHIDPDYVEHYHDWRIDASGSTIEEAYINLAANIDKYYNLDGTEKEIETDDEE